jgi:hypothetical protein
VVVVVVVVEEEAVLVLYYWQEYLHQHLCQCQHHHPALPVVDFSFSFFTEDIKQKLSQALPLNCQ